tara:strand:- start:672 stop:1070 length:399 start_codon:yes stop_codon:yes gene_type:complete
MQNRSFERVIAAALGSLRAVEPAIPNDYKSYRINFGVLGGSNPTGWLIIGVLSFALVLRFVSVKFMEGLPMITRSKSRARKAQKVKNTNLNPVTNVMKLCSVSFETVWALIVGWSAGLADPALFARLRQRHQ